MAATSNTKTAPRADATIAPADDPRRAADRATDPSELDDPQSAPPAESVATVSRLERLRGVLGRLLPTAVVLATLIGLGWYGHHFGWKIPSFSHLAGAADDEKEDWCAEHGVPESICIACNAELMPKDQLYGWCEVHGVHECPLENPEVAQLKVTPEIKQTDFERAATALEVKERPENDSSCKLHLRRIQFASKEAADKAGIDIRLVDRAPIVETIPANAEVTYDPTRVTQLAARTDGTAWRVEKNIGDRVKKGDILALIDAKEVGRLKAELTQAIARLQLEQKNFNRLANLEGVVAGKRLLELEASLADAEAQVRATIQRLANLGLPLTYDDVQNEPTGELHERLQFLGLNHPLVDELQTDQATSNLLPIRSPRDGVITDRDLVEGEVVDSSKRLFTLADPSQMWLMLDVPLEHAKYVSLGQHVNFQPDGAADEFAGEISWMSTDVDRHTRTVKMRAELPNLQGKLRSETFGRGKIVIREDPQAIVVPSEAVHSEGCCNVVFVRDKNYFDENSYKVFHTRCVRPGIVQGDMTEMIAGVWPGEVVATKGSSVLRAELLKGNLGAG